MKDNFFRIAICDDDIEVVNQVFKECKNILLSLSVQNEIEGFTDGNIFLKRNKRYDVVILDIDMPAISGFALAEKINSKYSNTYIIFLTRMIEWIGRGYIYNAFRYLLKPVNILELTESISSIIKEIQKRKYLPIQYENDIKKILIKDIVFFEAMGQECVVYSKKEQFISNTSLKELTKVLNMEIFCRCHRSYIVNFENANEINGNYLVMNNGLKIPISVRKIKETKDRYLIFLQYI